MTVTHNDTFNKITSRQDELQEKIMIGRNELIKKMENSSLFSVYNPYEEYLLRAYKDEIEFLETLL
jgi:hypothetical protein